MKEDRVYMDMINNNDTGSVIGCYSTKVRGQVLAQMLLQEPIALTTILGDTLIVNKSVYRSYTFIFTAEKNLRLKD
jgi:hypothetical protein